MAEVIGARVEVDASSVGSVRKQLKEATADLIKMQDQFGETSDQALQAAKRVAELRDRIGDAREVAELFDPGKRFQAFSNAISAVANGFTAVQGAMGLFGVESKEVEQQLLRVQSAMALSQGLSGLMEAGKQFKNLGSIIKTNVVTAFNTLKGAIAATGIGLLVVALGTIVAYWEDIKGLVSGVSAEQEKLNAESQANLKTQQDKLDAIDGQSNQLKLQGKSERDILQMKIAQTDEAIKAAEVSVKNAKITRDQQVAAAKRNRDILKGMLDFVTVPIQFLIDTVTKVANFLGADWNLNLADTISSAVFDPEEVAAEGDATIAEAEKTLNTLKEKRAGYQLSIQNIDNQAANKRKATADKELEDDKKRNEERLKQQQDLQDKIQAILKASNDQIEKDQDLSNLAKLQKQKQADLLQIQQLGATQQQIAQLQSNYRILEQQAQEKDTTTAIANFQTRGAATIATLQNVVATNNQLNKDSAQSVIDTEQSKQAMYMQTANVLGQFSQLVGQQTAMGKALAVAQIAINTAIAISEAVKQATKNPLNLTPINLAIDVAARAATILSNIAAARKILSQARVPGGAGGGGGGFSMGRGAAAPLQANLNPQTQLQLQNQQAINNMGNQAVRAYVLNSDIRNNNQRNSYLQRNSRIG